MCAAEAVTVGFPGWCGVVEAACERRRGLAGVAEAEFPAASQPVAECGGWVGWQVASGYRVVSEFCEFGFEVESDFVCELAV